MKRSRFKRKPKRDIPYEDELDQVTPLVMARARYHCEVELAGCKYFPEKTPHHRKRRSQGGPNTMANLLAVCSGCHRWIHAHPEAAYEQGLLIRRDDLIHPYQRSNEHDYRLRRASG